jgi:hypothetical protein
VNRNGKNPKQGQSYVGLAKLILWGLVLLLVFVLKLCGFDVDYPTVAP